MGTEEPAERKAFAPVSIGLEIRHRREQTSYTITRLLPAAGTQTKPALVATQTGTDREARVEYLSAYSTAGGVALCWPSSVYASREALQTTAAPVLRTNKNCQSGLRPEYWQSYAFERESI